MLHCSHLRGLPTWLPSFLPLSTSFTFLESLPCCNTSLSSMGYHFLPSSTPLSSPISDSALVTTSAFLESLPYCNSSSLSTLDYQRPSLFLFLTPASTNVALFMSLPYCSSSFSAPYYPCLLRHSPSLTSIPSVPSVRPSLTFTLILSPSSFLFSAFFFPSFTLPFSFRLFPCFRP